MFGPCAIQVPLLCLESLGWRSFYSMPLPERGHHQVTNTTFLIMRIVNEKKYK